jgi:D-lactate dehydrogenase (cytochrome)
MQTILKNFFSSNKPTRLSTLSRLEASDLAYFKQFLSESEIVADPQQLATFNQDWMKKYKGHSKLALIPNTTAKIQ